MIAGQLQRERFLEVNLENGPGQRRHHIGQGFAKIGVRPQIIAAQTVVPLASGRVDGLQSGDGTGLQDIDPPARHRPLDVLRAAQLLCQADGESEEATAVSFERHRAGIAARWLFQLKHLRRRHPRYQFVAQAIDKITRHGAVAASDRIGREQNARHLRRNHDLNDDGHFGNGR